VDLLLVPTALHHYTVEEIQEEEARGDKVRRLPQPTQHASRTANKYCGCWQPRVMAATRLHHIARHPALH